MIIIFISIRNVRCLSIIINSANRLNGSYHSFIFPMSGLVFDKIKEVDEVTLKMPAPYIDEFIKVTETDFFVSVDGKNYVNAKICQVNTNSTIYYSLYKMLYKMLLVSILLSN